MLKSPQDAPYLAVLQAVQAAHDSSIAKLTEASAQHSQTLAVHAQILSTIADTQRQHSLSINQYTTDAASAKASLQTLRWMVTVMLPAITIGVNVALYIMGRGKP